MKYDNLLDYIQELIQSPKYNFKIKLFDEKGNLTISLTKARWIVLNNENVMIEMPYNDNKMIKVWKDSSNTNPYILEIIQKIRKQAILNGVEVNLETYTSKTREAMKSIIKKSLENTKILHKDNDKMEEVKESKLASTYFNIMTSLKVAKRPSDAIITEGLKVARTIKLFNECSEEIASLKCFEGLNVKPFNNGVFLCKTLKDINEYINNYEDKELVKILNENISRFKNVGKFVKNRYASGISDSIITEGAMKFYPNVKLFKNILVEKDIMAEAYNELKPLILDAKCRTDIIRVLKENKICEKYNVSRKDLINYWLNVNVNDTPVSKTTEIKYVCETLDARKIVIPCENILGVRLITECLNKGGNINSEDVKNICKECETFERLTNFTKNYKIRDVYKKIANNLCLESSFLLHSSLADFKKNYRERIGSEKYTKLLEAKLRTNDPALYYISEELQAYENEDVNILSEGLKKFVGEKSLNSVVMNIIDNGITINKSLNESKNDRKTLEKLYLKLCENLKDKINLAVSSSIFYLIHKPIALNESQKTYIKTLIKYCR